jgi:hypothetical protein
LPQPPKTHKIASAESWKKLLEKLEARTYSIKTGKIIYTINNTDLNFSLGIHEVVKAGKL